MNKAKPPHIPTLAAELGFECRFRSGFYNLERDGIVLRYNRRHGSLELRLKGTLQKVQLPSLGSQPHRFGEWLRKLDKEAACDALRADSRRKIKDAQGAIKLATRDLEEREDEIRIWRERDWNK